MLSDLTAPQMMKREILAMRQHTLTSNISNRLTDKEIDGMMNKIIGAYEKELGAEIRK